MAKVKTSVSRRVQKVAEVICLFTEGKLTQLVCLVPQLREIEIIPELAEDISTAEYFRGELLAKRGGKPLDHDEVFIGEFTYGESLTLSEKEKTAFWDNLFNAGLLNLMQPAQVLAETR